MEFKGSKSVNKYKYLVFTHICLSFFWVEISYICTVLHIPWCYSSYSSIFFLSVWWSHTIWHPVKSMEDVQVHRFKPLPIKSMYNKSISLIFFKVKHLTTMCQYKVSDNAIIFVSVIGDAVTSVITFIRTRAIQIMLTASSTALRCVTWTGS